MIIFYARVDDGGLPPIGVCKHVKERLLIFAAPKASFFLHRRGFYVKKWVKNLLAFLNGGSSSQQEKGDSFAAENQCHSNRHAMPRRKTAVALAKKTS